MRFTPAIIQLRRAQLILILAVLVPTVLMTALGIVMLAIGSSSVTMVGGVLVLAFTTTAVTGYILGSIFLGKGASLARLQNDFFSSVSHELRTPVTSIRLLLEGLATDRLGPEERTQVITLLSREVARLDQLLVRTLDLSKIETGRHPFDMQPMPLTELVSDALAAFDAASLARPTTIRLELEPELVVVGDRATLSRALVNLLVNAWKYTGDDKQITLRARVAKRKVELEVADNGPGIEGSERVEVFEGFHRGKQAIDQRKPGVGLGLAIVRAIVRAHRGKVELVSRPGEGAVFRIILPHLAGTLVAADPTAPHPAPVRP